MHAQSPKSSAKAQTHPAALEPPCVGAGDLPAPLASLPPLLTPDDVASLLSVSERTLERWRANGEGPRFVKLSRNVVRYTQTDLEAFVAARLKVNTI